MPATLRVQRPQDTGGMLRDLRVLVDGERLAGLKPGESADLVLSPGQHEVQGAMDWAHSPIVTVDLHDGMTAVVEVSLPFTAVFRSFFSPKRAIQARVVAEIDGKG